MKRLKAHVPGSPPAVWTAFLKAGAWKSWALLASFALNFLLATAAIGFANRPPDVVLVDESGKGTYVNRSLAGDALVRFLDEQRHLPTDLTVAHFSGEFLQTLLAVNSSTIDAAWPRTLERMAPALRARMQTEADAQRLVETLRLASIRTEAKVEALELLERTGALFHVRATVARRKAPLVGTGAVASDRLQVDLVLRAVPRSPERPDGLEVAEYRNQPLSNPSTSVATSP